MAYTVIQQLGPFLGQAISRDGIMGTLTAVPQLIANARLAEVILALITLVIGTLLSLALLTGGGANGEEIRRIGESAAGFPQLRMPYLELGLASKMLIDAAVQEMLGCIDALLTAVIADSITRTEHNSTKELIGQGLDNLVSGLSGGIAGAGATMGTMVNIQAGGRSTL
jgi:SulP family sulfate permease